MKTSTLRTLVAVLIIVVVTVGILFAMPIGNLSAFGWKDIAFICPVGALTTLLASKTFIPRALISLVLAVIAIILLGRAFCSWACPVPLVAKLRDVFKRNDSGKKDAGAKDVTTPLSDEEKALLAGCKKGCGAEEEIHAADSRHVVLGAALLSAAIFGVPVFCLICPIGLTFATILLVILLFGGGDVTWSVVLVPVLLLVEVVFFRKWCAKICPLSAFMSLVGKLNRTWRPTVDEKACIELGHGGTCGRCADICDVRIDLRHPENSASLSECTRCKKCAEACPTHAIKFPFLAKKEEKELVEAEK